MNTKQFHRRTWAIVLLLALMVTAMGANLYDLQINNGRHRRRSQRSRPSPPPGGTSMTGTASCWCLTK